MRTYVYVAGCWRSARRTYMYVLGCWHENILVASKTVRGHKHTSSVAEMQIEWVRLDRIKDINIRPWLLERIRSAREGLNKS